MFKAGDVVKILIPNVINTGYDYRLTAPANLGTFVACRVMGRPYVGVVYGLGDSGLAAEKIKNVDAVYCEHLSIEDLQWIQKMSEWTLMAPGAVLKLIVNIPDAFSPPRTEQLYSYNPDATSRMTDNRMAVADAFASNDNYAMSAADITNIARVSGAVVRTMIKNGTLNPADTRVVARRDFIHDYYDTGSVTLNADQAAAANAIGDAISRGGFSVHLLDGITGSGKTQVYFDAVLRAYNAGKSVLLMMPEIALTAQFMSRFAARFGAPPVVWHSNLTAARRREIWRAVLHGEVRIVVGTRSALFLPWRNLGLIVVDEEHDPSYKQEDMGNYHARDMAVLRASIAGFPIVLASATPALETMRNAELGRYNHLKLTSRFGGAQLPSIETIDMRTNRPAAYTVDKRPHPASPVSSKPALRPALKGRVDTATSHVEQRGYTNAALAQAQHLRKNMTDAERELWNCLAQREHHYGFSRQRPIGKYIVDFVNFEKKIVIELDGAQHGDEHHVAHDTDRDKFLRENGFTVLRFWNTEVFNNIQMVLDTIDSHVRSAKNYPCENSESGMCGDGVPSVNPPLEGGSQSGTRCGVGLNEDAVPGVLSPVLCDAIGETLAAGRQAMLFINRRGFAPIVQCKKCGWAATCPDCSVGMTYHKRVGKLICHMCGRTAPFPDICPDCGDAVSTRGAGLEKIAEEVAAKFPAARVALVSSDTMMSRQALERLVAQMENGEIDIVIGTQILAKGHHFPNLTLVGVVDADMGLFGTDFRSGEHTFQQLFQVAGRAGRGEFPGRVLLQTYQPDHPVIAAICAGNRDEFYTRDMNDRRAATMPPFGQLIAIIIEAEKEPVLQRFCADLAAAAPGITGAKIMGPMPAQIYQIRNWYRMRFLVWGGARARLQPAVAHWLAKVKAPANVRVKIDVNPQNFS